MKVAILCGGPAALASREVSDVISQNRWPPIGQSPKSLWHIMKIYSFLFYGFNEFVLLLGYKGAITYPRIFFPEFCGAGPMISPSISARKRPRTASRFPRPIPPEPWRNPTCVDTGRRLPLNLAARFWAAAPTNTLEGILAGRHVSSATYGRWRGEYRHPEY